MLIETKVLLILPVALPLLFSFILLSLGRREGLRRILQVLAGLFHFVVSLTLLLKVFEDEFVVTQIGGWKAPFGITFIADRLSALMLCVSSLASFCSCVFSLSDSDGRFRWEGRYAIYYIMLAGVSGILLTGDVFNMYVWIELVLISSFVLLVTGGTPAQLEGALKYVMMNLLGSFLMLIGIAFLYRVTGTLNFAHLAQVLPGIEDRNLLFIVAMFFFVSLGLKAAVFPLYFWLPGSYQTAPLPVAAVFGGLLAKVGFYVMLRIFTLLFPYMASRYMDLMLVVAVLTMLTTGFIALAYRDLLKILSVQVVTKIGYLLLGLGLFTVNSFAGLVYYLLHVIAVKTNLFLIAGLTARVGGSSGIDQLGGMLRKHPVLGVLFLTNALSLAGVPPLSGFWAKFFLVEAAIREGWFWAAAAALITGVLTLISMTMIWNEAFLKNSQRLARPMPLQAFEKVTMYGPIILLTLFILGLSAAPGYFHALSQGAAEQISAPGGYVNAVLKR